LGKAASQQVSERAVSKKAGSGKAVMKWLPVKLAVKARLR